MALPEDGAAAAAVRAAGNNAVNAGQGGQIGLVVRDHAALAAENAALREGLDRLTQANNFNVAQQAKAAAEAEYKGRSRLPNDITLSSRPRALKQDFDHNALLGSDLYVIMKLATSLQPHAQGNSPVIDLIAEIAARGVRAADVYRAASEAASKVNNNHLEVRGSYYESRIGLATNPSADAEDGTLRLYDIDSATYKQVMKEMKDRKGISPLQENPEPSRSYSATRPAKRGAATTAPTQGPAAAAPCHRHPLTRTHTTVGVGTRSNPPGSWVSAADAAASEPKAFSPRTVMCHTKR